MCSLIVLRIPLLYYDINGGRYIAILFFICVTLAGFSSLISLFEVCVHVLEDYGSKCNHSKPQLCSASLAEPDHTL